MELEVETSNEVHDSTIVQQDDVHDSTYEVDAPQQQQQQQ